MTPKEMTPKEKADEIFTHYHNLIQETGGELGEEVLVSILAKECALYLTNQCQRELYELGVYDYYYWEEVEKLLGNY